MLSHVNAYHYPPVRTLLGMPLCLYNLSKLHSAFHGISNSYSVTTYIVADVVIFVRLFTQYIAYSRYRYVFLPVTY